MKISLRTLAASVLLLLPMMAAAQAAPQHKTRNVILVMSDGLRWQEVFSGADPRLLETALDKANPSALPDNSERAKVVQPLYLRATAEERRAALMPFLWSTVAKQGQIFGNRALASSVVVSNGLNFSYPGYSETLTGVADPRVHSNDKIPNPNVTVFEWLNQKPQFAGKVAAFGAWNVFSSIFNASRCGFLVNDGYQPLKLAGNAKVELPNQLKADGPFVWPDEAFDALPFYSALEYMKAEKPRVLFIGLGETDDWAHGNAYPEYLRAAHRADQYLRTLWETVQSMPEYRDNTTILFTADHGRGNGAQWTSHGEKIPESRELWFAVLGPDTVPLGERHDTEEIQQKQFAATLAALLGEDYHAAVPATGKPVTEVLAH